MVTLDDIRDSVLRGRPKEAEARINEALDQGIAPREIVEKALIGAMRQISDEGIAEKDGDITRILCAARCVRVGMEILEPLLEEQDSMNHLGTVILGTVAGDLHDVGKNLVGIMFRSVGFDVIDLGVDISGRQFLKALKEHPEADMICISSLLSTSLPEMKKLVASIRKYDKKNHIRIMVGGGAVDRAFAEEIGADAYTESAVEAATLARNLVRRQ